jgi:hypothetical protein
LIRCNYLSIKPIGKFYHECPVLGGKIGIGAGILESIEIVVGINYEQVGYGFEAPLKP